MGKMDVLASLVIVLVVVLLVWLGVWFVKDRTDDFQAPVEQPKGEQVQWGS